MALYNGCVDIGLVSRKSVLLVWGYPGIVGLWVHHMSGTCTCWFVLVYPGPIDAWMASYGQGLEVVMAFCDSCFCVP